MGYNKDELIAKALKILDDDENIYFQLDLADEMGISEATFYNLKLGQLEAIKEGLVKNKRNLKKKQRSQWMFSENATLQVALYKLNADASEFERLTSQKIDHTTKGEKIESKNVVKIDLNDRIEQLKPKKEENSEIEVLDEKTSTKVDS